MIENNTAQDNYKLLDYRLADTEKKLDIILEKLDLTLKANARLRVDLQEIITESIKSALNRRASEGYARITS